MPNHKFKSRWMPDHQGLTRIWDATKVSGTAVIYFATPIDHFCAQHDFEVNTIEESRPEEVRAIARKRNITGEVSKKRALDKLAHEAIVIFGPDMSAREAVQTLERLVEDIRSGGLLIGRDETESYICEPVLSGKIKK